MSTPMDSDEHLAPKPATEPDPMRVHVVLEEPKAKRVVSHWDLAERLSKIFAGVLIPLVGAWVGWLIHMSGTNAEYLKQAVAELSKPDANPALRSWAVDVFMRTSPVPVGRELEQALREGRVSLRPLAAAFRPGSDLSAWDLSGQDLSGLDLSRVSLARANLGHTILSRSNLSEANLSGASLIGANLVDADLRDALLDFADLRGATLTNANVRHVSLRGANVEGLDLRAVNGLEVEQLVLRPLQVDPRTYGGVTLGILPAVRWNSDTQFPDTIQAQLRDLGVQREQ